MILGDWTKEVKTINAVIQDAERRGSKHGSLHSQEMVYSPVLCSVQCWSFVLLKFSTNTLALFAVLRQTGSLPLRTMPPCRLTLGAWALMEFTPTNTPHLLCVASSGPRFLSALVAILQFDFNCLVKLFTPKPLICVPAAAIAVGFLPCWQWSFVWLLLYHYAVFVGIFWSNYAIIRSISLFLLWTYNMKISRFALAF